MLKNLKITDNPHGKAIKISKNSRGRKMLIKENINKKYIKK